MKIVVRALVAALVFLTCPLLCLRKVRSTPFATYFTKATHLSASTKKLLEESARSLGSVTNFKATLALCLRELKNISQESGHLFEIEKAAALSKKGFIIQAFNRHEGEGEITREFDIITPQVWIEVKVQLPATPATSSEQPAQQFLSQKNIVDSYNHTHPTHSPISFCICSKKPVTGAWITFCERHAILLDAPNFSSLPVISSKVSKRVTRRTKHKDSTL